MTLCYSNRSVPWQPSSEELPPAVDENKHREPQPDIMQTVGNLGTSNPRWNVCIKFFT